MRVIIPVLHTSTMIMLPAIVFSIAWAEPSWAAPVHPAVVRIIVPERGGASLGSGTLVAVNRRHGLVLTNWHVVRDGNGQVTVVFPDGFHSGATVLKTDRDWDLAALAIWRPHVAPVRLAGSIPRKGETLTIAGYGSGKYRMATGRCLKYYSPGRNLPFEMLELSAKARQGDSGGPIFNRRGELAGVLFGAAWRSTMGSHCGRVRNFMASITGEFNDLPDSRTMIARRPGPSPVGATASADRVGRGFQPRPNAQPRQNTQSVREYQPPAAAIAKQTPQPSAPWQSMGHLPKQSSQRPSGPPMQHQPSRPSSQFAAVPPGGWRAVSPSEEQNPSADDVETIELPGWDDIAGNTWPGRLKTLLAAVGLFAIFFRGMKLLGSDD